MLGADNVHVSIDSDLGAADSTIVVIDDGTGMDEAGFRDHWIIGSSRKREVDYERPKNRSQIGKFGIGKLATYVLASRLSHITKVDGHYYAASLDYGTIPAGKGVFDEESVSIPFRELKEEEAVRALARWSDDASPGGNAIKLFGDDAADSWTVTIMSKPQRDGQGIDAGAS